MIKITCVAGARPNFMKIAPLMKEFAKDKDLFSVNLVHTGQHYDYNLSKVFFQELGIPDPCHFLEVGSLPREEQLIKIKKLFGEKLPDLTPDLVLVVGDVNSTLACSEAAAEKGIKVAHVEAGLRSFDMAMPEELNRIATDKISDFLFTTERVANENLQREGIKGEVFLVGNVMIDTLVASLDTIKKLSVIDSLRSSSSNQEPYLVLTFHRPSNVDSLEGLQKIYEIIKYLSNKISLVFPIHPRTRASFEKYGLLEKIKDFKNLILVEPLGYFEFINLVLSSNGVLTDSGGIQEETTYLGIPCVTMRDNTERPATVELGSNILAGTDKDNVLREVDKIISGDIKPCKIPPLWDGVAAQRIVQIIKEKLS